MKLDERRKWKLKRIIPVSGQSMKSYVKREALVAQNSQWRRPSFLSLQHPTVLISSVQLSHLTDWFVGGT